MNAKISPYVVCKITQRGAIATPVRDKIGEFITIKKLNIYGVRKREIFLFQGCSYPYP